MLDLEVATLKKKVIDLEYKLEFLMRAVPRYITLSNIAQDLGKSRQTLLSFIKKNFEYGKEFYKKDGKIFVDVSVLPIIRGHYEK